MIPRSANRPLPHFGSWFATAGALVGIGVVLAARTARSEGSSPASAATEASASAQDAAPPPTLALLVGIGEYATTDPAGEFAPLGGPENDVARAKDLLIRRFGFDPAGIVTLVGPQATHEAIVRTFHRHLIVRAGPDTRVVFWFSGHGARIPDASGQDHAGRDAGESPFDDTLVAYDSRREDPAGSYDFTDDELHSLLAALRARDVVVVTDCCHSGGVLRGARGPGVREGTTGTAPLSRARIEPFWPKDVPLLDDDDHEHPPAVVQIAACGAHEEAGELTTEAGVFGTLTWFLTNALHRVDPQASWSLVAADVRARVAGHGTRPSQQVQVIGDGRRAVFGGRGRPVPPGYLVDRYGARGLLIGAGRVHGLGENAELRLVDLDGNDVGSATVYRVSTTTSNAEWVGDRPPPTTAMRALPRTFGDEHPPLRVWLEDGIDAAVLAGCDVAVPEPAGERAADYALRRAGHALALCDRSGRTVRTMRAAAADVRLELLREHRFRSLWEGIAEPGRFRVEVTLTAVTPDEAQRMGRTAASVHRTDDRRGSVPGFVVGAPVLDPATKASGGLARLVVRNTSDQDLHLALVALSENREVHVLYGKESNNLVRAGQEVTKLVWLGPAPGWPADQPMVDRYVAIATVRYADFQPFAAEAPAAVTRGGPTPEELPPFLRDALGGGRTRGGELEQPAWGIAFCDVQIVRPEVFAAMGAR